MHQSWIAGSMLAAGASLFGLAIWIQTDSRALTTTPSAETELMTQTAIPAVDAPLLVNEPARVDNDVIVLPEIEIRRAKPALHRPPPAAEPVLPRESTEPCSPWREIGPVNVDDGEPSGSLRVRLLC